MSSEITAPKDHGKLSAPAIRETKPRPIIPRFLAQMNGQIITNLIGDEAIAKYGEWEIESISDKCFGVFGKYLRKGDRMTVPGNVAWELTMNGQARFTDPSVEKENQILEAAKRLEKPKAKDLPAFQGRKNYALGQ